MAYEPKVWECGETITADALNHLEQGIAENCGGGTEPLIIKLTDETEVIGGDTFVLSDTKRSDVDEAIEDGRLIWIYGTSKSPTDYSAKALVTRVNGSFVIAYEITLETNEAGYLMTISSPIE